MYCNLPFNTNHDVTAFEVDKMEKKHNKLNITLTKHHFCMK